MRARIFEPYFSTKTGGTGLGLAIVSSIVTEHHGFVRVRDNKPHGSRFVLEFPVKE
jgi:two-component system nitrogen regulation sensor histidine kinase NtrY